MGASPGERMCIALHRHTDSDIYLKDEPTTARCPHVIIGRQELFYSDQQAVMH